MKSFGIGLILFVLASCATAPRTDLNAIAEDYVRLTLEIGERSKGYVDAYFGPAEWRTAAAAAPRTIPQLAEAMAALRTRIDAVDVAELAPMDQRRHAFLIGQIVAAQTRLRMIQGETLSFSEEAQGLFAVDPDIRPLAEYDPVLARIEQLVPGTGPLADRVDAFQAQFVIPADRLDAVMQAAISECRRRTLPHIAMPENERFKLEFVTDKSWSGYNWYQGNHESLIQINTDLPVRISRAVDLGCHEGYPGHHVNFTLMDRQLANENGWVEFLVYPLFSPQSLIAEGSANYGRELAFPGPERLEFETRTLYPLAGLPTDDAERFLELQRAMSALSGSRFTIARDYLEGRIDRDQAVALTQSYQLVSRGRAEQMVDFIDEYRTYVINYGLGLEMVKARIEAVADDPEARWAEMKRILSEPTMPADLLVR